MRIKSWLMPTGFVAGIFGVVALARGPTSNATGPEPVMVPALAAAASGPTTAGPTTAAPTGLATPRAPSFQVNVVRAAEESSAFRRVLFTGKREQVVLMSLAPRTSIGEEVHPHVEQVFFIVSGSGRALVEGRASTLSEGDLLVVTPGVRHDVVNDSDQPLKLFTIYAPPNHLAGRVHETREDAEADYADERYGESVQ